MRGNPITDQILKELVDNIENSLKQFVLEHQSTNEWKGLDSLLQVEYDLRLDNLLKSKGGDINYLESSQKLVIINRKQDFLKLVKESKKG